MTADFPELNSFGTLLKFAIALEKAAAELAGNAAERKACARWQDDLDACRRRHTKRGKQLTRLRRERLNEVVLQAITGMAREQYLPALELPDDEDPKRLLTVVAAMEETVARFYADGGKIAAGVLAGVDRTFQKLASESVGFANDLRGKVS